MESLFEAVIAGESSDSSEADGMNAVHSTFAEEREPPPKRVSHGTSLSVIEYALRPSVLLRWAYAHSIGKLLSS
jgi:hypothetical protein